MTSDYWVSSIDISRRSWENANSTLCMAFIPIDDDSNYHRTLFSPSLISSSTPISIPSTVLLKTAIVSPIGSRTRDSHPSGRRSSRSTVRRSSTRPPNIVRSVPELGGTSKLKQKSWTELLRT